MVEEIQNIREEIRKIKEPILVKSPVVSPVVDPKSLIEERKDAIINARCKANKGQKKQADAMLAKNKKKGNSYKIDDHVLLKVDGVDRGAADPDNLLCVILD